MKVIFSTRKSTTIQLNLFRFKEEEWPNNKVVQELNLWKKDNKIQWWLKKALHLINITEKKIKYRWSFMNILSIILCFVIAWDKRLCSISFNISWMVKQDGYWLEFLSWHGILRRVNTKIFQNITLVHEALSIPSSRQMEKSENNLWREKRTLLIWSEQRSSFSWSR